MEGASFLGYLPEGAVMWVICLSLDNSYFPGWRFGGKEMLLLGLAGV